MLFLFKKSASDYAGRDVSWCSGNFPVARISFVGNNKNKNAGKKRKKFFLLGG